MGANHADYAAIILAGGAARRLGGLDKPALPVAGVPMIARVLRAVRDASTVILVGPGHMAELDGTSGPDGTAGPCGQARLGPRLTVTREQPPGAGPVAAVAAALRYPLRATHVAILGGDMPLLTAEAIGRLLGVARDGAVFVDADDREQWLCGVWRTERIQARLNAMDHVGAPLRRLFDGLDFARVRDDTLLGLPPWFDCDTAEDIARAEEWLDR